MYINKMYCVRGGHGLNNKESVFSKIHSSSKGGHSFILQCLFVHASLFCFDEILIKDSSETFQQRFDQRFETLRHWKKYLTPFFFFFNNIKTLQNKKRKRYLIA